MTAANDAYMGASDAFSWHVERDPVLRPSVVLVAWLDRAPEWNALVARVDRTSRLIPSLRQRVIESPLPVVAPRWTYDPHFDLDWHVHRVRAPEPRTRDAVLQFARQSAMDAFARARPLWELTLMEGLEDGGAALIVKVHHSLSDGVSGVRMLALVADPKRKPRSLGTLPPAPPDEPMDQLTLVASTVGRAAEQLTRLAWQPAAAIPALARAARDPAGFARGAVAMA